MRERLIIGAIAVVVIGVTAFQLSQPRKGTVEWHERKYWTFRGQDELLSGEVAQMRVHEAELLKNGFLISQTVLVSNTSPGAAAFFAMTNLAPFPENEGVYVDISATNAIRIVTRTHNAARLAKWEQLIRQADLSK